MFYFYGKNEQKLREKRAVKNRFFFHISFGRSLAPQFCYAQELWTAFSIVNEPIWKSLPAFFGEVCENSLAWLVRLRRTEYFVIERTATPSVEHLRHVNSSCTWMVNMEQKRRIENIEENIFQTCPATIKPFAMRINSIRLLSNKNRRNSSTLLRDDIRYHK